jgi:hypothetical protein
VLTSEMVHWSASALHVPTCRCGARAGPRRALQQRRLLLAAMALMKRCSAFTASLTSCSFGHCATAKFCIEMRGKPTAHPWIRLQVYATASAVDAAAKAQAAEYDSDDNLIVPDRLGKTIEPLKPLDHDQIEYEEFTKDFYEPAAEIAALTEGQVTFGMLLQCVAHSLLNWCVCMGPDLQQHMFLYTQVHERRRQLGVRSSGFDAPSPVATFQQCGFDGALLSAIRKAGFTAPTPIQAQALPAVLSGRDVLVRMLHNAVCVVVLSLNLTAEEITCPSLRSLGRFVNVVCATCCRALRRPGQARQPPLCCQCWCTSWTSQS